MADALSHWQTVEFVATLSPVENGMQTQIRVIARMDN